MREMKDSGVAWIGKIPRDKQLLRNKYSLMYEKGRLPSETNNEGLGYPYIGASDLDSDQPYLVYTADISLPDVYPDDLLVLWDGARAGICGTGKKGKLSSTIVKAKPINASILKRFLYWYYKGFEWYMLLSVNGTTIPHMNRTYIEQIGIIDWSVDEQRRIADYLDAQCARIDRAIARQQEVIEKLKEYKLAVITEAVTKGLNPDVPMKDSGIEWIGEIPEHWNILKLKYTTSILRGKFNHRPRNDPDFYDGIYPFVQTGDVAQASKYLTAYSQTLNELGYSVSKEFPRGSIVMTIAANVGDVAILDFDACFPDSVVGFIPNNKIQAELLFFIFKAMKSQLTRNAIISTQLNLNIEIIKEEYIPVASIKEQFSIIQFLEEKCREIELAISSKQSIIDKLIEYKKSLIYEVVTGKREV